MRRGIFGPPPGAILTRYLSESIATNPKKKLKIKEKEIKNIDDKCPGYK